MEAGENALSQMTPPIQPEVVVPAVNITETAEEEVPVDCKNYNSHNFTHAIFFSC